MVVRVASLVLASFLVLVACGADGGASPVPAGDSPAAPGASPGGPASSPNPQPGGFPGEYADAIYADAEQRTGVGRDELVVRRAQEVIWADEALGCPQPGETPAAASIEGYQMVLEYLPPEGDRVLLDYRVRADGSFILCEESLPDAT